MRPPKPRPPRTWPLVALGLMALLIALLAMVWPAGAQASENPQVLCLEPRDAHRLWGRARVCEMELRAAPECSTACAELAEWAEEIEEGVSWAILPDGTAEQHPDGRYRFGSRRDWERVEGLIEECRSDMEAGCRYVPGEPSTGRMETELVPGGDP